jgi:uncharacterized protein
MRPATATATAVTTLIGVGAAAAAAGRLAANAALNASHGRALPAEPRLSVHATAPGRVTLTRCLASLRPGVYGLEGSGVHAVVGPVIDGGSETADTVVRRLDRVTYGTLTPGTKVRLTPQVYTGDPRSALGIDHADVDIPGELGSFPAWFVPGPRPAWVITVHGLGTGREHPMNVLGFLHDQPPRTAPDTSARPSGATWTRPSATPCATGRSASSCTVGPPAPPWPCTPPQAQGCAT